MIDLRAEARRAAAIAAHRQGRKLEEPIPPPLPPGSTILVPGRGELFARRVDGPPGALPVLLLHGWMWTADLNWWPVYEPLGRQHPVLAVDHRDHGRSMMTERPFSLEDAADDAAALLDVLGIAQVLVCGYSMGGPIALLLAERHPDKVAGMVLAGTTLDFSSGSWLARARWRLLPLLGAIIRHGHFERGVARYLSWVATVAPDFAPYRTWARGEWRRQEAKDILHGGEAMARFDMRERVAALRLLPSVVLLPRRDQLVEPWRQRALAAALDAEVVELEGNHFANLEAPRLFADAVVEAVERVTARIPLSG